MSNLDWIEHINVYIRKYQIYLETYNNALRVFHEDITVAGTEIKGVDYGNNFNDPIVRENIYKGINKYLKEYE